MPHRCPTLCYSRDTLRVPWATARLRARSLRAPLRHRSYRVLLGASTISQSGDWLYNVALAVYVFDRTGSAGLGGGRDGACGSSPTSCSRPIGGLVADRFDRRSVMIWSDVAQGVAMGALAAVAAVDGPGARGHLLAFTTTAFGTAYRARDDGGHSGARRRGRPRGGERLEHAGGQPDGRRGSRGRRGDPRPHLSHRRLCPERAQLRRARDPARDRLAPPRPSADGRGDIERVRSRRSSATCATAFERRRSRPALG